MRYTQNDFEIFKKCFRDYNILEKEISDRIKKGYNIERLYDYIRHLSSCHVTHVEMDCDFRYFEFDYMKMSLSICQEEERIPYIGENIEVWNDYGEYIDTFNCIREIEYLIKEYDPDVK